MPEANSGSVMLEERRLYSEYALYQRFCQIAMFLLPFVESMYRLWLHKLSMLKDTYHYMLAHLKWQMLILKEKDLAMKVAPDYIQNLNTTISNVDFNYQAIITLYNEILQRLSAPYQVIKEPSQIYVYLSSPYILIQTILVIIMTTIMFCVTDRLRKKQQMLRYLGGLSDPALSISHVANDNKSNVLLPNLRQHTQQQQEQPKYLTNSDLETQTQTQTQPQPQTETEIQAQTQTETETETQTKIQTQTSTNLSASPSNAQIQQQLLAQGDTSAQSHVQKEPLSQAQAPTLYSKSLSTIFSFPTQQEVRANLKLLVGQGYNLVVICYLSGLMMRVCWTPIWGLGGLENGLYQSTSLALALIITGVCWYAFVGLAFARVEKLPTITKRLGYISSSIMLCHWIVVLLDTVMSSIKQRQVQTIIFNSAQVFLLYFIRLSFQKGIQEEVQKLQEDEEEQEGG